MKKKYYFILIAFLCLGFSGYGQVTIGIQDFDGGTPEMTYTGGSNASGNGLFPATPKYTSNSNGRQVSNTTQTIEFSNVDASLYTSINFKVRLASFANTSGNGADGSDYALVEISNDGGTTWSEELRINGNNNAKWGFSGTNEGTATASSNYDGDNTPSIFAPTAGGYRDAAEGDGYTFLEVNNLPNSSNLKVRIQLSNNSNNEIWVIDDAEIEGILSTDTSVQFTSATSSMTEDGVFIDVCASIINPSASNATTVDIALDGASTATNGTDYDDGAVTPAAISFPQTLTFPANDGSDQCFTIYISNDDSIIETDETIVLNLTNVAGGNSATIGSINQHTVTINDNDFYDSCNTSVTIPVNGSCINQSFTNVGATDSGIADPGCASYSGGDVWFNLTVPASGAITVETSDNGGITNSGLALYSGTCGSLTLLSCDDDSGLNNMSSITETGLTPGQTIYVRVWEFNNNDFGTFGICAYSAPEIDVERNTNASIPLGTCASNPPNTGNNTLFTATNIGSTSTTKLYYIQNEGSDDLTVSTITFANGTDFNFVNLPTLPATIAAGNNISFEIEFAPNTSGNIEDTVTINSDDTDEATYTFCVGGEGVCVASPITISPSSGPVNTVVTVNGNDFLGSTTATVDGVAASINIISDTLLEVTIPSGASTGSIDVNNNLGCINSEAFTVIDNLISSCEGSGTPPAELFISEITDHGTGSHSYVEIYNGTGSAINLTGYEIRVHNNGSATPTSTVALSGTIANDDVFVLAFGSVDATNPYAAHGYDQSSAISGINDDDNIRLYNNTTWVDLWGDISGTAFTVAANDYTYRRKNTGITAPSTTWNASDWDAITPADYSDIGTYDYSIGTPPTIDTEPTYSSNCEFTATLMVSATEGYNGVAPADTKELAYQWYYSAPGDSGWTAVSDDATYDNVTTNTLTINNILNASNYQFYCQVREDDASCYTASEAVQIDIDKTTWTSGAWDNGTPDITRIAVIDENYTTNATNGSFSACSIFVTDNNRLTIDDSYYVEIENHISIDGEILVETKGALVQNSSSGTVTVNASTGGKASVDKETAPLSTWLDYTYWSSPVSGETIGNALADSDINRRFWFNASNFRDSQIEVGNNNSTNPGQDDIDDNGDDWTLANGGDTMLAGVGYAATHSQTAFVFPNANYKYSFVGPFNNGDISTPVVRNDAETNDNNWNFIGNPYPSAIDVDLFFAENNYSSNPTDGTLDGAIYLWSHDTPASAAANGNENMNFIQSDYALINGVGETAGGDNNNDNIIDADDRPNRYIASGQGFFISYSDARSSTNGFVRFNNSMRVKSAIGNSQFFRTSNNNQRNNSNLIDSNKLWISFKSDNGAYAETLVGYVPGATNADDGSYFDARKNLASDAYISIYSTIENDINKFAIQGKAIESLTLDEVIPLGFSTSINEATIYTIAANDFEGEFLTNNTIYLKDNLLNVIHDLSSTAYNFTSETGEFNERFEIIFTPETLSVNEFEVNTNDLTIIELNNGQVQFNVSNHLNMNSIEILDLLGKRIYKLSASGHSEILNLSKLSQATYIVIVELSDGQKITKKAIKRK